jgi:hypothetical protein
MTDTFKDIEKLENDLWQAADNLPANSKLTSSDYSGNRGPMGRRTSSSIPVEFLGLHIASDSPSGRARRPQD